MTNTNLPLLSRESGDSLVQQIVRTVQTRIDDRLMRCGARMPSIRDFAATHGVSRFTVVEAYDRLVAGGFLESRRGSGFYVKERSPVGNTGGSSALADTAAGTVQSIDIVWLIRNMFRQMPAQKMPGGGLLPPEWL